MGAAGNSGPPDRIAILRVDLFGCHPPIWREIEVPMKAVICVDRRCKARGGRPSVRKASSTEVAGRQSAGALLERHPSEQRERTVGGVRICSLYRGGGIWIDEPAP